MCVCVCVCVCVYISCLFLPYGALITPILLRLSLNWEVRNPNSGDDFCPWFCMGVKPAR